MKSRRRIASLRAQDWSRLLITGMRLQQGFANGEMGFALQKSSTAHVSYGSQAEVKAFHINVRFTPKSGHCRATVGCPLCAKSGHCAIRTPRRREQAATAG
jgi:hypothetical protein